MRAALVGAVCVAVAMTMLVVSGGGAEATAAPTRVTTVRPVTAAGTPAKGWTAHRTEGPANCGDPAPAAVDRGIAICYPAAIYLPACWKSSGHSVLCARDVTTRKLVRVAYSGTFSSGRPQRVPAPQNLVLGTGVRCSIRVGGAWGFVPGHPNWTGFYACSTGSLYGPGDRDGIDRSHARWRVHLVKKDGTIVTRTVRRAYVVGTAGSNA
ncbi:MAG: hypothetical protein J2O46_09455 [Nocardioides sp.]|nr:hypothetical protein [Nocardioides sp.]